MKKPPSGNKMHSHPSLFITLNGNKTTEVQMLSISKNLLGARSRYDALTRRPSKVHPRHKKWFSKEDSTKPNLQGTPMATTSIIHSDDAIGTRLFANWITDNYAFSLDKFIPVQEQTITKVLEDDRFDKTMTLQSNFINHFAFNSEALIIFSKNIIESDLESSEAYFEIFAKDIDTYYEYYQFLTEINEQSRIDTLRIEYHAFSAGQFSELDSDIEYFDKEIFDEVTSVFYEPYLDTDLMFEQFLQSRSVILQLTGKPGIGKSKLITLLIKYLIEHPEHVGNSSTIKIARPASSDVLALESFWVKLRQNGFHALILDDVDHILQKRNKTVTSGEEKIHNDIVRKILTFTDGLTSQKTKILISTNLEYHDIDQALIRDFRMFDSIELRPLKRTEALAIWKEHFDMDETLFYDAFEGLEEITAAKLSKAIEDHMLTTTNHNGQKPANYLKEEGISKVKSMRERKTNTKRIGMI
jgi:hypothetical protein